MQIKKLQREQYSNIVNAGNAYEAFPEQMNRGGSMKNTIKKAAVCLLAVMLTGCMKITVTYDVAKDGNVKESVKMLVGEKYLTMGGGTPEDGVQDMMESFQESYPDAVMTAVSEDFEDETYHGFIGTKAESELKAVKDGNKLVLTITRAEVEDMGGAEDLTENASSSEEVVQAMKDAGFSANIVVNMPYNAETTYGTAEGKTVTIDALELPEDLNEIVITCRCRLSSCCLQKPPERLL